MATPELAIQSFQSQLLAVLVLRQSLRWLAGYLLVWATIVLIARAGWNAPVEPLLWGLAGVPLVVLPAWWRARRQAPTTTAIRATLDDHSACGGLLMAGAECDTSAWQPRLPAVQPPTVRWRLGADGPRVLAAAVFLLACFVVPRQLAILGDHTPLEIGREADKVAAQIHLLKQEKLIAPQRASEYEKKLDQLKHEASGRDPVKTLEALDHLAEQASQAAKQAVENLRRQAQKAEKAQTLAEALCKKDLTDKLDAQTLTKAMNELAALTRKAAAENEKLQAAIDDDTIEQLRKGGLSPEALQKLAEQLGLSKQDIKDQLDKLKKAGLIDPDELGDGAGGEPNAEDLLKALAEGKDGKMPDDELADGLGNGGVDEGGGSGPLNLGGPGTEDDRRKLKEETLPTAKARALKDSQLSGLSRAQPKVTSAADVPQTGALAGAATGGGSTNAQTVLPRHKAAVEQFFERPGAKPK
jgi:hypothetical protein